MVVENNTNTHILCIRGRVDENNTNTVIYYVFGGRVDGG